MNGNPVAPNGGQGAIDAPPCGNQQCGHQMALLRAANQGYLGQIVTLQTTSTTQAAQLNGQINQLRAQVAELIANAQPAPKHHEIVR